MTTTIIHPPPPPAFIACNDNCCKTGKTNLEAGAILALKNISSASDSAVVSMCVDDRLMNMVCSIYEKCSPGTPIRIAAASADAVITVKPVEEDDPSNDDAVKPTGGLVKTTEEALAPWDLATARARTVSPVARIVSPERKAGEYPHKNGARQPPLPSLYLDGGWLEGCTDDSDDAPPGVRLMAKKALLDDAGTAPSARPVVEADPLPSSALSADSSPFKNDPVDETFLETLHDPLLDTGRINPVHMIVRDDVLEVRRTGSGKVFLQCSYCKHLPPQKRANQSIISPQSIRSLYRANVRFLMYHVPNCTHIPARVRAYSPKQTKLANFSGGKRYWEESARVRGLRDDLDRKCMVYCLEEIQDIETNEN
jgi:hypothetical protein